MSAENGRLTWEQLAFVGTSVDGAQAFLGDVTASAWLALQAACLRDTGVTLRISPNGGYRTLAQQQLELDNGGAAVGTSMHGERQGAVDIWNWLAAWSWLQSHSSDFGFVRDVAGENWHHHLVRALTLPTGGATPVITTNRRNSLMRILICGGQYYQIGAGFLAKPRDTDEGKNLMTALYGAPVPVSSDQLNEALTNHGIPWDVPGKLVPGLSWNRGQLQ